MKNFLFSDLPSDIQEFLQAKVMGSNNKPYKLFQYGIPLSADLRVVLMESVSWAFGNWPQIVFDLDKDELNVDAFRSLPEYKQFHSKRPYKDLFVNIKEMKEVLNGT